MFVVSCVQISFQDEKLMTPLQACRNAKKLSLQTLSAQLEPIRGSSIATLSRMEAGNVKKLSKELIDALVDKLHGTGLTASHIQEPEQYPDFKVNYSDESVNSSNPMLDDVSKAFNEQEILINLTRNWIENSSVTVGKFSIDLYELLAVDALVEPCAAESYEKWVNTKTRRVERILKGELQLPLSWKLYWLACLPENVKQNALSQMMANIGYMLVPLPTTLNVNPQETAAKIDEVSRQFADVIQGSKPAMDGKYDERDDEGDLQLLQDKLMGLVAVCLRESTVIERCTGVVSKLQQIWALSPLRK